ncbi:MAG: GH36 C-terminal domain-containing protein, partial [Dorea sp.]|nr:GH36 C-terminal domain-containing protein [Dorea sp.]
KKYAQLIAEGDYYRLTDPYKAGNFTAWETVSKDKKDCLLSIVLTNQTVNGPQEYVKVKGLIPNQKYSVNGELTISGSALKNIGIPVPRDVQDYSAFQYEIKAI